MIVFCRTKSSAFEMRAIIPTVHLGEKEMSNDVGTVMCPIRLCFECRLIPCESPLFCFDVWGYVREPHAMVKSSTIFAKFYVSNIEFLGNVFHYVTECSHAYIYNHWVKVE